MSDPLGSKLTAIDHRVCAGVIASVFQHQLSPHELSAHHQWLLAHCDGGVIWGKRSDDGRWLLSSDSFDMSPKISADDLRTVQQLRLFNAHGELLIWRINRSGPVFAGRLIVEGQPEFETKPLDARVLLLGDRVLEAKNGFWLIGDATGACHAVPIDCGTLERFTGPAALRVRHYFERHDETGALRVAATRLCGLTVEEP